MTPFSVTGRLSSNSAEKAWCALAVTVITRTLIAAVKGSNFRMAISCRSLRLAPRLLLLCLILSAGRTEAVCHRIIRFVTGILDELVLTYIRRHGHTGCPWLRPDRRIFDLKQVLDPVRTDAPESFGQTKVLAGPLQRNFAVEIGDLHNERVTLPATTGDAVMECEVGAGSWAVVYGDDSRFVDHLFLYCDVSGALHNLNAVVVATRLHDRLHPSRNAAAPHGKIFPGSGPATFTCRSRGRLLFRFRSHRRKPSVGRIHDQRRLGGDALLRVP